MSKDLNLLLAACDPATSGHGKEDVHGESHRKVFKMDASDFIVRSDLVGSSLVRTIEDKLLRGKTENKHIRAEPNRLNIYGKHFREVSPVLPHLKSPHPPRQGFVPWDT